LVLNFGNLLYQFFGGLAAAPAFLWLTCKGRFGTRWADRLGYTLAGGQKRLWFHGASVGEAQSALSIINSMADIFPQEKYVLSVGTPAGIKRAQSLVADPHQIQVIAPPVDFYGSPGRALNRIDPRALIIVETELWPGLIRAALKRNLPVLVLAGRLSQKSLAGYKKIRSFLKPLISQLAVIAAITETDRERFLEIGAQPERTVVMGNPKFDSLAERACLKNYVTERPLGTKIIVAGSTEESEEQLIVNAWQDQARPRPRLVLAPRHLGRVPDILEMVKKQNLSVRLFSENQGFNWESEPDIIILDVLGVLAGLYAVASLAIIGGSFYCGQGHNPLEPAVYGCPVIFGPHMSSFWTEARDLVEVKAAKTVPPSDLSGALAIWLALGEKHLAGQAGQDLLADRAPVGPKLAKLVGQTLSAQSPSSQGL
jgi:3-deoxy-D-manno-octulosonic-acid transferase